MEFLQVIVSNWKVHFLVVVFIEVFLVLLMSSWMFSMTIIKCFSAEGIIVEYLGYGSVPLFFIANTVPFYHIHFPTFKKACLVEQPFLNFMTGDMYKMRLRTMKV